MLVRCKKLTVTAILPTRKHASDAGADLYADRDVDIAPGEVCVVSTGVAIAIPEHYEGQVRPRSGLASEGRVAELGTIDAGYRGEVKVICRNDDEITWHIRCGDRIAQLVVAPIARAVFEECELDDTERGARGFGSSGK